MLCGCEQPLLAQTTPATPHDGAHDFDFNIGTWHTHIHRFMDPFSPTLQIHRSQWHRHRSSHLERQSELEEIQADGPNGRWEGMTLFLYNPESHEWSQTFANDKMGAPDSGNIGYFSNGRVELYGQDTFQGKSILVRAVWSDIKPDGHHYTESYSNDARPHMAPILHRRTHSPGPRHRNRRSALP